MDNPTLPTISTLPTPPERSAADAHLPPRSVAAGRRLRVVHLMQNAFLPGWARRPEEPVSTLFWPLTSFLAHADQSRFEIFVASLAPPEKAVREIPGAKLFVLDCPRRADYPQAVLRLARWLRRESIDVIHTHLFDATVVGLTAAKLVKVPVIMLTGHHSAELAFQRRGPLYQMDVFYLSRLAHQVVAPSRFMRDAFVYGYGLDPARVPVIEHGLDRNRMVAAPGARERIRDELGLTGKTVLGAVGRLTWVKQHAALIRSFASLAPSHPDAVLVIVGLGGERDALLRLISELGMQGRVILTGARSDMAEVMAAIDLFVHCSMTESFGLALLEALAAGKPALSTDVGIAPDIVENERTGILIPMGEPSGITEGLHRMMSLRSRWGEMGQEAARRAAAFSAERMVAAYEARYQQWFSEARRPLASPARNGG